MSYRILSLILAATLVACTAPTRLRPPPGVPTAELNDSLDEDPDGSNRRVFAVWALDGVEVLNAARNQTRIGFGAGTGVMPYMLARPIAAKPTEVQVVAEHFSAAPIESIVKAARGRHQSVRGTLQFTPEPNIVYRVAGRLSPTVSYVWIEEFESGKVVTEKLAIDTK